MDCIAPETVDRGYVAIEDGNVATGGRPSCVAMATRTLQQETKLGDGSAGRGDRVELQWQRRVL